MPRHRTSMRPSPVYYLMERGLLGTLSGLMFLGLLIAFDTGGLARALRGSADPLIPTILLMAAFGLSFAAGAVMAAKYNDG